MEQYSAFDPDRQLDEAVGAASSRYCFSARPLNNDCVSNRGWKPLLRRRETFGCVTTQQNQAGD
jgi:hypothetical protein